MPKKIIVTLLLSILALGLSACEQRPKQQFMEWVVRDAWDPVCSKDAAVERFVVKNAGWENQNNV